MAKLTKREREGGKERKKKGDGYKGEREGKKREGGKGGVEVWQKF